jgi:hypothetical protein
MSMCNAACPIHSDQSIPNLVSSHYLKSRNFQKRMQKHTLTEYTLRKQDFRPATAPVPPRNGMLPLSNLVSSHYLKSRNFQERMEKHTLSEYTMRKQVFRPATARVSPRKDRLPLSYVAKFSWRVPGNEPLTAVLPCQKVTLRVKSCSSVSRRGFFLPHTTTPCLPRTSAR